MDVSTVHITMLSNSSSYDAHTLSDNDVINDSAGIGVTDTANDHSHSDDTSEDDSKKPQPIPIAVILLILQAPMEIKVTDVIDNLPLS